MKIKFNINDKVRVRLTDSGRKAYAEDFEKTCGSLNGFTPAVEVDGWSTWQLWSLMSWAKPQAGQYLNSPNEPPFETEIEIVLDDGLLLEEESTQS